MSKLPEDQVPSIVTICKIIKERFNLKYKKLDKANTKYRDDTFNDKRVWISRLMAQFLMEDAIIICIDESNFRHDALPGKQWQFNMSTIANRKSMKSK